MALTAKELVDLVLQHRDAAWIVAEIQQSLLEEQVRRQQYLKWLTPERKAEFVQGKVVMQSPACVEHLSCVSLISIFLGIYVRVRNLGEVYTEKALIHLKRNDYLPDICYFSKEKVAKFGMGQMLFPAPDLIVEVLSKSTAKMDRTTKHADYAAHGVPEYWIVHPTDYYVEQYVLLAGTDKYLPATKLLPEQDLECKVIPGFTPQVKAFFDDAANLKAIKDLLR